jgi:hypothetical protein
MRGLCVMGVALIRFAAARPVTRTSGVLEHALSWRNLCRVRPGAPHERTTSPATHGACALWALREHRVDDLDDELLTCARQLGDCGDLLLQLGCRAALGGLGRFADEGHKAYKAGVLEHAL